MGTSTSTGTLTAGNSRIFTLAPGAALALTLSPNPRVTITETPESIAGSGVGGNATRVHEPQLPGTFAYGPYAMGGVVVVAVASNSGSSVAWTRKDTVVTMNGDGTSLVDGDRNVYPLNPSAAGNANNRTLKRFTDNVGVGAGNSGTAATVTIDANSPFGRPAYKVELPAGNTYHEIQLTGANIANFDGNVIWRVWIEDYTKVGQLVGYAGISGYSRLYQHTHQVNTSNLHRYNGEHIVRVGTLAAAQGNTFVGGTDTLADNKLRIFPTTGLAATVWVDAVIVPGVGRPTHILTFDDCSVTWIENVLPYLAEAGLAATFAISTGDLNGSPSLFLSSAQLLQIANAGHQISCHNITNTAYADGSGGGTQTAAQYTADFVTASATLSALVGQKFDPGYHPWVQGYTNSAVMDTMWAAGVQIARGTSIGHNWPQVGLGNTVMQLRNQAVHALSQPQIDQIFADMKTYGTTNVWMVHEVTQAGGVGVETSVANFRYLAQAIAADVRSGAAVHRTASQFAREVYRDRLVAASLLA